MKEPIGAAEEDIPAGSWVEIDPVSGRVRQWRRPAEDFRCKATVSLVDDKGVTIHSADVPTFSGYTIHLPSYPSARYAHVRIEVTKCR